MTALRQLPAWALGIISLLLAGAAGVCFIAAGATGICENSGCPDPAWAWVFFLGFVAFSIGCIAAGVACVKKARSPRIRRRADWYPDPKDPERRYRYWNGTDWTDDTAPR